MLKTNDKEWELKDGVLTIHDGEVFDIEWYHELGYREELSCCKDIIKVILPEGLKKLPHRIFENDCNLKDINIPNSVGSIDSHAFSGCESLKSITLPDNLKTIDENAFSWTGLKSITIPENVEEIGYLAFTSTGLKSVIIPENVKEIGSGAFSNCQDLSKVIIKNNQLTTIPPSAFGECESLKEITIPGSIKCIDSHAFGGCKSLEEITIPESIEWISFKAFYLCKSLKEITIPATAHCRINASAFEDCVNLKKVILGAGVDVVEYDAFKNCKNLKRIDFANDAPIIWHGTFDGVPDDAVIGYMGREINAKDLRELVVNIEKEGRFVTLSEESTFQRLFPRPLFDDFPTVEEQVGYPVKLSEKEIDDFLAKKEKEKKPEKKKAVYRGR